MSRTDTPAYVTGGGSVDGPRGMGRGATRDVGIVLGSYVLLGVAGGVLWWLLAPTARFTKLRQGGAMDEVELSHQFGAVGWYVVVAAVLGLLAGLALTWWRARDALLTSGLLLVGAVLAAGLSVVVGHLLGPGDPQAALATARLGAQVPDQLHVATWTAYLAWPAATLAGALVVLLGRIPAESDDDLSQPWPGAR